MQLQETGTFSPKTDNKGTKYHESDSYSLCVLFQLLSFNVYSRSMLAPSTCTESVLYCKHIIYFILANIIEIKY